MRSYFLYISKLIPVCLSSLARNVKLEIRQIGGNFRAYHNFSYDQNTPEALKGAT